MTFVRHDDEVKPWVCFTKGAAFADNRLSLAARGLLAVLLDGADDEADKDPLLAGLHDAGENVELCLRELQEHGYVNTRTTPDGDAVWEIFDVAGGAA